jgi:hypothetical protein
VNNTEKSQILAQVALANPDGIRFAAQVLDCAPCPKCDYPKEHCRCKMKVAIIFKASWECLDSADTYEQSIVGVYSSLEEARKLVEGYYKLSNCELVEVIREGDNCKKFWIEVHEVK